MHRPDVGESYGLKCTVPDYNTAKGMQFETVGRPEGDVTEQNGCWSFKLSACGANFQEYRKIPDRSTAVEYQSLAEGDAHWLEFWAHTLPATVANAGFDTMSKYFTLSHPAMLHLEVR